MWCKPSTCSRQRWLSTFLRTEEVVRSQAPYAPAYRHLLKHSAVAYVSVGQALGPLIQIQASPFHKRLSSVVVLSRSHKFRFGPSSMHVPPCITNHIYLPFAGAFPRTLKIAKPKGSYTPADRSPRQTLSFFHALIGIAAPPELNNYLVDSRFRCAPRVWIFCRLCVFEMVQQTMTRPDCRALFSQSVVARGEGGTKAGARKDGLELLLASKSLLS